MDLAVIGGCALLLGLLRSSALVLAEYAGGYLTGPPSRNYVAFRQGPLLPSSSRPLSSLPEREPTPHNLNSGRTCGTVDGNQRDYNSPKSRAGTLLPLNVQGVYVAGDEIEVTVNLFGVDAGGHFEFSACPVRYPEAAAEECFQTHPLEFVRDRNYGAPKDENYPNRAYIPYRSAFDEGRLERVESEEAGPGGASMMDFSYTFKLPTPEGAEELSTELGILVSRGLPNGDSAGTIFAQFAESRVSSEAGESGAAHDEAAEGQVDSKVARSGGVNSAAHEKTSRAHHEGRALRPRPNRPDQSPPRTPERNDLSSPLESNATSDRLRRRQQWIAASYTASNSATVTTPSLVETTLISSLSTDGNGTTTIVTLNGDVTVVKGGPKVPASSTLTFGSKEIYGDGVPLDSLPGEVKLSLHDPPSGTSVGRPSDEGAGQLLGPSDGVGPDEGGADGPSGGSSSGGPAVPSSEADKFAAAGSGHVSSASPSEEPGAIPPAAGETLPEVPVVSSAENMTTVSAAATSSSNTETELDAPNQKYVLLRWRYITARDCYPPGYDSYPWPTEAWGEWPRQWGGACRAFGGYQNEYWNCAEILVLGPAGDGEGGEHLQILSSEDPGEAPASGTMDTELEDPRPPAQAQLKPAAGVSQADWNEIFAKDDRAETIGATPVLIDVTANDIGDALIITKTGSGRHGSCIVTEDNQVEFTADVGFQGRGRCAYVACLDAAGSVCDEGWVFVRVLPNSLDGHVDTGVPTVEPTAASGTMVAVEDKVKTAPNLPVRIDVVANDQYTGDDGMPVVTEISDEASSGTCQVVRDGSEYTPREVLYTPDADFAGWDRCTYKICLWTVGLGNNDVCDEARIKIKVDPKFEADGGLLVAHATAPEEQTKDTGDQSPGAIGDIEPPGSRPASTLEEEELMDTANLPVDSTASAPNSDPIAKTDTITIAAGEVAFVDVLANDRDPDSYELEINSWTSPQVGGARVEEEDGILKYIPEGGYSGKDSFMVTVCNEVDRCDTSRVIVKIISEVFAVDDEATTSGSIPVIIDVAANDISSSTEPLLLTHVGVAKHGVCELISNKVRYTPPAGGMFEGWDRCVYIVCSGGECDKGRAEIRVLPVELYEKPVRPTVQSSEKTEVHDAEEIVSTLKPTSQSTDASLLLGAEEAPPEPLAEVSSGEGVSIEKVYAEDETVATSLNTPITVDVASNDFVKGMGPLTLRYTGGSINGKCRITNENKLRFIPGRDFVGTDHCVYSVCQGSMCDEGIISINVIDRNGPTKQQHGGLVSNYQSSGGLTLGPSPHQRTRTSAAIACWENGNGRKLIRGIRTLKNILCVGSSLVTTDVSGESHITYTSTYHQNEPLSMLQLVSLALPFERVSPKLTEKESKAFVETVITLPAAADAVIMPGFPDECFGHVPTLLVSGASSGVGIHETLLRFETAEVDGSVCEDGVIGANLFLYSLTKSSSSSTFITTSDKSWSEDEVAWSNAPEGDGIVLASRHSAPAMTWRGVDVSSAFVLGEALSVRVISEGSGGSVAQYASREHEDPLLKPVLNITCISFAVGENPKN